MREIDVKIIKEAVCKLFIEANHKLPCSLVETIKSFSHTEKSPVARGVFSDMIENLKAAEELDIPICQDTGMAVLFIEIGQNVHFIGGSLYEAINEGVARAYTEGFMRCSIVADPLKRENTRSNTPALIHTSIVDGENVRLTAAPKGFGSENMSKLKMLTPSANEDDIVNFVLETVKTAGSNPCPPIVVGVGIGSDFEGAAILSKKALCRDVSERNADSFYANLENRMLLEINKLNIGPQGFGGNCTALAVNIETGPTHIAGLPVAVNIGCHVTRHSYFLI